MYIQICRKNLTAKDRRGLVGPMAFLLKTFEHGQILYVIFRQSAISNPSVAAKVLILSSKSSNQLFAQEGPYGVPFVAKLWDPTTNILDHQSNISINSPIFDTPLPIFRSTVQYLNHCSNSKWINNQN